MKIAMSAKYYPCKIPYAGIYNGEWWVEQQEPTFYPESRQAFTLPELKEIVKEMEKFQDDIRHE